MDLAQLAIRADSSDLVRAKRDLDALPQSSKRAESATSSLTKSYSSMGVVVTRLIGVLGAAGLGATILKVTDQYTKLNAQLSIAARTQADYTKSMQDVIRISNLAQSSLDGTATLYARLANTLKDTNVTQQQFANITESVALGLRVSGASVGEAQSAMLQLSQAFASGVLRGEEFNAVSEASFPLMKALADSMGIPIEQLRSMAMEGKITRNELVKAFSDQALIDTFKTQAKEMNTVSGALQVMKNNLTVIIGEINATTGASNGLAQALLALGNSSVIRVPFETLAVIGVNIAYVFKQIGNEIGGIAAQLMALVQFDFKRVGIIRDMMLTDAKQARIEVDALSESILNPKTTKGTNALSTEAALINTNLVTSNNTAKATSKAVNDIAEQQSKEETRRLNVAFWLQEEIYKAEKERIETANKLQAELDKEIHEARQKYIAIEQQRANDNFKEAQEAYRNQVSNYEKIFDRANENLSRSLTDSIVRGFENGEKFITNFKNAITNAFKGYFVNIGVNFVQEQLSGIVGNIGKSLLGAVGLGDGSQTGGFKSIFSDLGSIFTKSNQSIIGGIESVGASIANGMGGIRDTIGGFLGSNASLVANVASYGGAVLQLAQGNWAGAAGTAIGTALGGPLGGAIGSFLGGAVGGLFGGKKIPMTGDQAVTSFNAGKLSSTSNTFGKKSLGGGGGLQSANEAFAGSLGTLINEFDKSAQVVIDTIYRSRTNTQGFLRVNGKSIAEGSQKGIGFEDFLKKMLGPGLAAAIRDSAAIPQAIRDLFSGMNEYEPIAKMINAVVGLNNASADLSTRFGITTEQAARVAKATGLVGDELVGFIGKLAGAAQIGKTPAQQILAARDGMQTLLQSTFGQVITSTFTEQVAKQVQVGATSQGAGYGGYTMMNGQNSGAQVSGIASLFRTITPVYKTVFETVTRSIDTVVLSMEKLPQSVEGFDSLLKGINKTTEAGQQMFLTMFNMRDQFIAFTQAMNEIKQSVADTIFGLRTPQEQLIINQQKLAAEFAKFNLAVPKSAQQLIAIGEGIDYTTEAGLNLALAFPTLVNAFQSLVPAIDTTQLAIDKLVNSLTSSRFETFADFAIGSSLARQGVGLNQIPVRGSSQGSGDQVAVLLTRLIAEVSDMKASTQQTADNTLRTKQELEDITSGQRPLTTVSA